MARQLRGVEPRKCRLGNWLSKWNTCTLLLSFPRGAGKPVVKGVAERQDWGWVPCAARYDIFATEKS